MVRRINLIRELFGRSAAFARRTDRPIPSWFENWLEAEGEAHTLRLWSAILVPGLLQTAEYEGAVRRGRRGCRTG